jgi:hypothetical protein
MVCAGEFARAMREAQTLSEVMLIGLMVILAEPRVLMSRVGINRCHPAPILLEICLEDPDFS